MWRRLRALEAQVADHHPVAQQDPPPQLVMEEPRPGPHRDRAAEVMMERADPIDRVMAEAAVGEPGACHLVLGDSIARDWRLAVDAPDTLVNKATGGNSFRRLAATAVEKISEWRQHCGGTSQRRGTIIIWCGGNDVYGGRGLRKEDVTWVLEACGDDSVLLLGPTPRAKGKHADKDGINWRSTNAYYAEAVIAAAVADAGKPSVEMLRHMGRKLCVGSRQTFGGREGVFAADGIHLSAAGYRRLAGRLTATVPWLKTEH